MSKGLPRVQGTVHILMREDMSGPSYGLSATEVWLFEGGFL